LRSVYDECRENDGPIFRGATEKDK
jgi:hypothetical protein